MPSDHSVKPPTATDWSRTSLGDPAGWPGGLRLTVDIMLNAPLAMLLMWGRQQVMVFNTAYVELSGTATLRAPGGKVPAMLPPAWSWNPAAIAAAWDGRGSQFPGQVLPLWRDGALQHQRLDLYYTPLRDDAGEVAGILCALAPATTVPASPTAAALDILVVEDNADARYLACEMLRALGHRVHAAGTGEQALPALTGRRHDVLFSDVSLPGMSGVELARLALARQPDLQIIFASGHSRQLTQHLEFPAVALQKPYDVEQLQAGLEAVSARLRAAGT
ncbi:response regulator [Rugamonas sp.]|uniref:response regulator n=1 Tax=Rugamonas sp. TaxID=1926287 RepID=UPI0025F5615C|nr:response regulator [Rugamonas sp.]